MRRALIAGVAFVLAPLCARAQSAPPAAANDAAATAQSPLDRAAEKTDLTAEKTPPYRLHAKITFHGLRTPFPPAEYTLLWADRQHWRSETRWPDVTAIEVASGDRIWRKDTDARRLALEAFNTVLEFPDLLNTDRSKVSGPQRKTISGTSADCFKITPVFPKPRPAQPRRSVPWTHDVCLLPANGSPIQIKSKEVGTEYDFAPGDYLVLGMKRFPSRIVHSYKQGSIEVETDSLEPLDQASANAITPPPGAAFLPWCRDEKLPRPLHFGGAPSFYSLIFIPDIDMAVPLYQISGVDYTIFDVTKDGTVKDVRAYNVHGSPVSESKLDKLRDSSFTPAVCGDKVIEAELVLAFPR